MSWKFSTTLIGTISAVIMVINMLVVFHTKRRHVTKFWTPLMISMMLGVVWIVTQALAVFTPKDHLFGLGCISYPAMYLALAILTYFSALLTEDRRLINLSIIVSVGVAVYILVALPMGVVFEAKAHLNSFGYLVIKDTHVKWLPDVVNAILLITVIAIGLYRKRDQKSGLLQKTRNILRFSVFLPIIAAATLELGILDAGLHVEHPPITMLVVALASTMLPSIYRTIISLDKTTASLKAWEICPLPILVLDSGAVLHTNPAAEKTFRDNLEDVAQRLAYQDGPQTITLGSRKYAVIRSEIEENLILVMLADITDKSTLAEIQQYFRESVLGGLGSKIADIIAQFEYDLFGGEENQHKMTKPLLRRVSDMLKDLELITRMMSGERIHIAKQRIPLRELAEETARFYQPILEIRQVAVSIEIPHGVHVLADKHLLARMLRDVMGKLVDITPYGGEISLKARSSDDTVLLEVSTFTDRNTDGKIAIDVLEKIIRELMGGDIYVEFGYRGKVKITITLPRG